ncbi:MFS nicotinic acid transporter-like protein Tna1 [Microthyrium microscopicum]|uniref:MFS nicotinic acid transporter-like protein Tna1 n=1 Tax=Microthyrium microscopicum TaxID=703497 RepID=A0A6A6UF57_9PEZI|nr:MFS nicotinic acid transporter-like protein Tna1 [Microthyrium microscopicum]
MATTLPATENAGNDKSADMDEKRDVMQDFDVDGLGLPPDPDAHLTPEERAKIDKKLLRKLDWLIIPWLSFLYLISFLDRTNIGNARIYGLQTDLGNISDSTYSAALTVFFISYALLEPLTNILMKRLRPSIFIPSIILAWGICMTCMGLVSNGGGLIAVRFFLGVAEAGLFPGVNYYLSCWYKRSEFGARAAVFFSAAAFAGSFGGLLAAAIANMHGVGGKPGWAWIFILEGLFTVLVGIASYWMVHDFPDNAKFLSEPDRIRVRRRLALDGQASAHHEEFDMRFFWESVKDWKTYAFAIIYMGTDGALYAFSLFTPTIIKQLGYTATKANLLSVPPYAAAAIMTISVGVFADRTRQRGLCNIVMALVGMIGFCMLIGSQKAGVKYAGTFLGAMGIYPTIANTIAWCSNNVEGVFKRGVTLGFVIGWGNLNGIVSSNIYPTSSAPHFYPGHGTVLGYLTVFLFGGSIVTSLLLRQENKKRINGQRDHWLEGKTPEELRTRGDKRPDFQYVV